MRVIGIATAAVWAFLSMGVFAAESGRIGKVRGNLETRLENGELTQEEYDSIIAERGNKGGKKEQIRFVQK